MMANWIKNEEGIAALESAFVFPILMILLLGVFDLGNGLLVNQKVIRSSQIIADLIARERVVDDSMLSEVVEAGRLALVPFSDDSFGYDIVSIRFDEDAQASISWRETVNMSANADVLSDASMLAQENDGVLVVSVRYLFEPVFAGFLSQQIEMEEVAFARGRKSATVARE